MVFQYLFVADMYAIGALESLFPTHDWKHSTETDHIQDIDIEIKWKKVLCGGGSLLTVLGNRSS